MSRALERFYRGLYVEHVDTAGFLYEQWATRLMESAPAARALVELECRLEPHLDEGNRKQTMAAPYTAIVAYDLAFADHLTKLIPHAPNAKDWFAEPANAEWNAIQSGTLMGAYLLIAARSLGLDCGPMNGFRREGVDQEFFLNDPAMKSWRSNFLINIGHGDDTRVRSRAPRLDFDEACRIL